MENIGDVEEYGEEQRKKILRESDERARIFEERIEKCPHTIQDVTLGMRFCVECGFVTQEQTFHLGGGHYSRFRPIPKKKVKKEVVRRPRRMVMDDKIPKVLLTKQ